MITRGFVKQIKFNGGLNTLHGPYLAENQTPHCKNVVSFAEHQLERRNGFTTVANVNTVVPGSTFLKGNGLFDFWRSSSHYMAVYLDTKFYYIALDVFGNWADSMTEVTFAAQPSNDIMEFEQYNEGGNRYLITATHDRDILQKWEGPGQPFTVLSEDSAVPRPKFIKVWLGYLFCANVLGGESEVHYNEIAGLLTGASDWRQVDYEDIRTHDGDFVTGLALLRGRLYTFKRFSIHRWTYFGGTPLFGVKDAITGIGAGASKSIVNISHPTLGDILIFLGQDKRFYGFDGSAITSLSEVIQFDNGVTEFFANNINPRAIHLACAVNYTRKHWYVCFVATGNSSFNNACLVWDYYNNAWWYNTGMSARCVAVGQDVTGENVYFVQADGKIQEFDKGNTDAGSAIPAVYDTAHINMDSQPSIKHNQYIDIQSESLGNFNINFQFRCDWQEAFEAAQLVSLDGGGFILNISELDRTDLAGSEAKRTTIDLPTTAQQIQCRFSTNNTDPAWRVFKADLVTMGSGFGKTD